tara:strand:+ start:1072 stop:1227 length:156 start_codon:yes stop_codon:yes gene_type:complete
MSEKEDNNIPTIQRNFADDFITISYPNGKVIKSYIDGRKKDVIIFEGENDD